MNGPPFEECVPGQAPSSRRDEAAAGWYAEGAAPAGRPWERALARRKNPKWDTFSWLAIRALLESANDVIAKRAPTIVRDRRRRYVAAQRAAGADRDDFVIDWTGLAHPRFLVVGDPGEADASQYATIEPLLEVHRGGPRWEHHPRKKSDFMVVMSDVIYPAGDINDYVNGFYIPFEGYDRPIYALPGNHDWYDGLSGFMFHHCAAEPLPSLRFSVFGRTFGDRVLRALWQRANRPNRDMLARYVHHRRYENLRREGDADPDPLTPPRPVQPAPYFAIELDELILVAIDTGVGGELDAEQGEWLLRVSARRKPKVLLSGKPIRVNSRLVAGEIAWGPDARPEVRSLTVDDIVRRPEHCYVAAMGGDTHNYQRYPVRIGDRVIQYVVSGGGGAYLSATHTIPSVEPTSDEDGSAQFSEEEFRCYPLRGDSLALFCRRLGPALFKALLTAVLVAAAAALVAGLVAIDDHRRGAAVAAAGGVLCLGAIDGVILWMRQRIAAGLGSVLALVVVALSAGGVVALLLALGDRRDTMAVVVAMAVPVAVVLAIVVSYVGRGSLPSGVPDWLLALPVLGLAPALWAPYGGSPARQALLYVVVPALAALVLLMLIDRLRAAPLDARRAAVYRTLVCVAWLGVTLVLLERFGPTWMERALATVLASFALIAYVVPRLAPGRREVHQPRYDTIGPEAGTVAALSIATCSLVALEAVAGRDAPAVVVAGVSAMAVSVAAVFVLAVLVLARANPLTLWYLRTGDISPDGAARFVSQVTGAGLPPTRPGQPAPGDAKRHGMAAMISRLGVLTAIADTNEPPFYKSFLSMEIAGGHLEMRCWGITGYDDPRRSPSLEDCILIALPACADRPRRVNDVRTSRTPRLVMEPPTQPAARERPEHAPDPPPRTNHTFRSGKVQCAAWYYRPAGDGPAPCVVIAHGFDGVRTQRLDVYAERFAAAGIGAFVFDYRYFGASGGTPRQLVSNRRQLEDWRAAIQYVRGLEGVDRERIALWGTSTSGGHVIKLAAADTAIAAVVTQMPFADGFAQFGSMPITQSLKLVFAGVRDQIGALVRLGPYYIPAAGRPYSLAAVTTPDALSGLDQITPCRDSTWENKVAARFALSTTFYRPGLAAKRLKRPLLVCIGDGDRLIPRKPALKVARYGTLRRYPFSHFGMYYGDGFDRVVADQAQFLRATLLGAETQLKAVER